MALPEDFKAHVSDRMPALVEDIVAFSRVPSVTSDDAAIAEMADVVETRFRHAGFEVLRGQVDGGHPSFIARLDGESDNRLLFFNHYDVDAPGPSELWDTPPFEPYLSGDNLFGRGVADNKASMLSRLHAVEALVSTRGASPCGVTFLIEAKKSMDAPHLGMFVDKHRELLAADACVWENSTVSSDGSRPTFRLGDKGMLMISVVCTGTSVDLSSQYSPIFPSAAWKLVGFLARVKGPDGTVLLPGFRDRINPLSSEEQALIRSMPLSVSDLSRLGGVELRPDPDLLVRYFAEPTANIASLTAGPRSGQKMMSVNPAEASASLDFRLVPDQDPDEIAQMLHNLAAEMSDDPETVEVDVLGTMSPGRTPVDHPFVGKMRQAAAAAYGAEPALEPMSPTVGSRSVLNWSGMPIVGYGVSYAGSNIQAPNEHIRLDDYSTGVLFIATLLDLLGERQ